MFDDPLLFTGAPLGRVDSFIIPDDWALHGLGAGPHAAAGGPPQRQMSLQKPLQPFQPPQPYSGGLTPQHQRPATAAFNGTFIDISAPPAPPPKYRAPALMPQFVAVPGAGPLAPPPQKSGVLARSESGKTLAPQETSAPKGVEMAEAAYSDRVRLFTPNEDLMWRLMETNPQFAAAVGANFSILHFHQDRMPVFVDEVLKRIKRFTADGEERQFKRVERISDNQELCICSHRPELMLPDPATRTWHLRPAAGPACQKVRNTAQHRRKLGNYYYTGFCADHVFGEGAGSLESWKRNGMQSVLGFNLHTPHFQKSKTYNRHFLCVQTTAGKVFLKWCTQCHTWKNIQLYTDPAQPPAGGAPLELRTFCEVCHERQRASRQQRRTNRKRKPE